MKEIVPYTHVSMWDYLKYKQHTVIFFYVCELENEEHIEVRDIKINTYQWINRDELLNYKFLPRK